MNLGDGEGNIARWPDIGAATGFRENGGKELGCGEGGKRADCGRRGGENKTGAGGQCLWTVDVGT